MPFSFRPRRDGPVFGWLIENTHPSLIDKLSQGHDFSASPSVERKFRWVIQSTDPRAAEISVRFQRCSSDLAGASHDVRTVWKSTGSTLASHPWGALAVSTSVMFGWALTKAFVSANGISSSPSE